MIHLKSISLAPCHACPDNGPPSFVWWTNRVYCCCLWHVPRWRVKWGKCGAERGRTGRSERRRLGEPSAVKNLSIRIRRGVSYTVLPHHYHTTSSPLHFWSWAKKKTCCLGVHVRECVCVCVKVQVHAPNSVHWQYLLLCVAVWLMRFQRLKQRMQKVVILIYVHSKDKKKALFT